MLKIIGVKPESVAHSEGIEAGDYVVEINGIPVEDLLDLHFLTSSIPVEIRVKKKNGARKRFLYNRSDLPLGLIPEPVKVKKCKNKCIFCFVHQLPKGLRKSLYVKDEDYRLSFLSGNFVTLSDLTDEEIEKIVRYRLSPLYVSIHTVDNELRRRMLGNPYARDVNEVMEKLIEGGITLHGQVVLCPGINDGDKLEETVSRLEKMYPGVKSLAVVPVGLTRFRERLPKLTPVTGEYAKTIVEYVERRARENRKKWGEDFVYASDEFYILSGVRLPSRKRYGDFPQIENGVGILRKFLDAVRRFERMEHRNLGHLSGVVPTGTLAFEYVRKFLDGFNKLTGAKVEPVPVENAFLGKTVTVTGLLTGRDVVNALKKKKGEYLFVPSVMLRESGDRFLDDLTPSELERISGKKVVVFEPDPVIFYRKTKELMVN